MEKKPNYLSLGSWPRNPFEGNHLELTPITKRILAQVHLKPQEILPLTFVEFSRTFNSTGMKNQSNKENFEFENERRSKQVSILADIRNKYILGKDYNSPITAEPQKQRSLIKSREISKKSTSQTSHDPQFSNLKLVRTLSRTKSQRKAKICSFKSPITRKDLKKQDSDYFIHFNPHKQNSQKNMQKHLMEQQSTKSKGNQHKKSSIRQQSHSEYGNFFLANNTKRRMKKDQSNSHSKQEESKQLCHELLITMERWEELDREHLKEMRKMKDLNQHEKDRLSKIQQIEKTQMRSRIKKIKSRLSSQNHQI